jgi:hypothetical protein
MVRFMYGFSAAYASHRIIEQRPTVKVGLRITDPGAKGLVRSDAST